MCKDIEGDVKAYFSRPFIRRLKYLYTGLHEIDNLYVLGNLESNFEFCDPTQCTGLVQIIDEAFNTKFKEFLAKFSVSQKQLGVLILDALMSTLNKVKWNLEKLTIEISSTGSVALKIKDNEVDNLPIEIFYPMESYFSALRTIEFIKEYIPVFLQNTGNYYDIPFSDEIRVVSFMIDQPLNEHHNLLPYKIKPCKSILFLGHDLISFKHFIKANKEHIYEVGIRLWQTGPRCLNYGGYYRDSKASLCLVRDNIFIFPKTQETSRV